MRICQTEGAKFPLSPRYGPGYRPYLALSILYDPLYNGLTGGLLGKIG